jgi:hypothetical protein
MRPQARRFCHASEAARLDQSPIAAKYSLQFLVIGR